MKAFTSVTDLFDVLDDTRPGDVVFAREHHLQCAALLQREFPTDVELQIAGLVHDVASSLEPRPDGDHGEVGARLVLPLLGARVARLVAGHVVAKRWLVAREPAYRARLSANSVRTLRDQGDALSAGDRAAFEASADFDACIALRRADDAAKATGVSVPGLDAWEPLVERLVRSRRDES